MNSRRSSQASLTPYDHRRNASGMTYVYPVMSRRAGGLSVGINLNPNNACNWHCVYCQVPDLTYGTAPDINLEILRRELADILQSIIDGTFYEHRHIPHVNRNIRDVALSGNGEPTSAAEFATIVSSVDYEIKKAGLGADIKQRLITNGSLMHRSGVRHGVTQLNEFCGEVWFKLDAVATNDIHRINGINVTAKHMLQNLSLCASLCTTWLQTCLFKLDGTPAGNYDAYLAFLARIVSESVPIAGVMLYTPVRQSMQTEAGRLSMLPLYQVHELSDNISALGVQVLIAD